jgi:hypothetical protein
VAGLAPDAGVPRLAEYLANLVVTVSAGSPAGVDDGSRSGIHQCASPVVPVLAKSGGDDRLPDNPEEHDCDEKNRREPDQMGSLFHRGLLVRDESARRSYS